MDIVNKLLLIIKQFLNNIFINPIQELIAFLTQYVDELTLVYFLIAILGGLLIAYSILSVKEEKKKSILGKLLNKTKPSNGLLDHLLDKLPFVYNFELKVGKKVNVLDKETSPRHVTKQLCMSMAICIAFGIYLKNMLALIPLIFIGYAIPIIYLDIKVKKKRNILEEQLGNAIKMFVTEFTTNKSVISALDTTSKNVKPPLKNELDRLLRKLHSGEPHQECFMDFAYRLDNKWAYLFSKLIIDYFDKGTDFSPHLLKVTEEITEEQIRSKENRTELTAFKATNLIINLSIPVVYLLNKVINPEQAKIFTETMMGRKIMFFVILGSFISLILGLKLENM